MIASRIPILLVGLLAAAGTIAECARADEDGGRKYALLVGCTKYANLPQRQHLGGPANDVVLMYRLLQNRFQFADSDIVVLAEPGDLDSALAAYEMDIDIGCEQPTAAHIVREFERLVETVRAGDQVFILLAGHGSQQPDLDADFNVDPEPDGFDEVFLPRDVGRWASSTKAVENAITDDQLRSWTTAMVGRGAFVFFVADSCHSGTVARGFDDVTSRDVSRSDLGIPEDVVTTDRATAGTGASADTPGAGWLDAAEQAGGTAGLIALYAAQPNEEAIEFRPQAAGPKHGRLSYAIYETFEQCDRPITYSELEQRLLWTYSQRQWTNRSTPDLEGTHLDREVLGLATWQGRSDLTLRTEQGRMTVSGGALQRITRDSILTVYPPAGTADADEIIGYVVVTESRPFTALVEPIDFLDMPAPTNLPDHARCELHHRDPGDLQITVAVDADRFSNDAAARAAREDLERNLTELVSEDALFRFVDQGEPADWHVVLTPEQTYLQQSGSRFELDDPDAVRSGEVLGPLTATRGIGVEEQLRRHLERIAWASNLVALSEQTAAARNPLVDIRLEVQRDSAQGEPTELRFGEAEEYQVRDREILLLQVTNTGLAPVSIIVFYVDANYGVDLFFPYDLEEVSNNRIGVGESLYKSIGFEINATTVGWEHVLVFAVPATDEGTIRSLRNLAQAGVGVKARGAAGADATPLARLVERAASGARGAARRVESPPADTYAVRRVTWQVVDDGS